MSTRPLSERALVVRLSINLPGQTRKSDAATAAVDREFESADSGRYVKDLYGKDLRDLKRKAGALRDFIAARTAPYDGNGGRLFPVEQLFVLSSKFRELREDFEAEAQSTADRLPALIEAAERRLGKLFHRRNYPATPADFVAECSAALSVRPVPDSRDDLRAGVSDEDLAEIRAGIQADERAAVSGAVTDCYRRLLEPLQAMAERLSQPDAIFRDSLIGNMQEAAKAVKGLNFADDPDLEAARQVIEAMTENVRPNALRNFPGLRAKKAAEATNALAALKAKMADYYGQTPDVGAQEAA